MALINRNPRKTVEATQPETEDQYVARMLAEEKTEHYRIQFRQNKILKEQAEARAAAEAPEVEARNRRFAQEVVKVKQAEEMSETETCTVCGTANISTALVSHVIWGTDNRCVRKPSMAKSCGLLNSDQWDLLTDKEKQNGFIQYGAAMLSNAALLKSVTKEVLPGTPNPLHY